MLQVLEMYPEFMESFNKNLQITYNLRDEHQKGLMPILDRKTTLMNYFDSVPQIEDQDEGEFRRDSVWEYKNILAENQRVVLDQALEEYDEDHLFGLSCKMPTGVTTMSVPSGGGGAGGSGNSRKGTSQLGSGILEFSPEKAGLDVTPANYNFGRSKPVRQESSLAGQFLLFLYCLLAY